MERFQTDHDELRERMRRYATLMEREPDQVLPKMCHERMTFARIFHRHRQEEGAALLRAVRTAPHLAQAIESMTRSDAALSADYSAHVTEWTPQRIRSQWSDYRDAVLALQARLKLRMAQEERLLHPMLGQERD